MSQRGYRRDGGRQSYQMNSSANYGGRSGQMNVNPWEGGMVPGGRGGVAGLLPTPTQGNILSQLSSSPEAQLAIASNLLSTLLRPQQPQVPSLLSLGSLGPMGNSGGGYRHSGYGPDSRYDQGPNRRKRMDTRRTEPYKTMQNRRLPSARGGAEKKPGSQGLRSPSIGKSRSSSGSKSGGKGDRKDDDKEPKKDKDQDDDKSEAEKKTDEEDGKRDDEEEGKKRDWKDEKKSDDSANENEDDKEKDEKSKEKDEKPHSRYSGIPPDLFYCHVCKKHMWDENSFQNHLKGRTHLLMMDKLEESYKIRVELMRHEQKVREQQREIELERMKRQGKKVNMNIREYCTMCDLHFFGNLIVHRKNDRHQQLKNFLHPRCLPCGKEFPTRVEWDHHKLTPLHLRKTAESSKYRKSGSDDEFGIEALISGEGSVFGDDGSKSDIKFDSQVDDEIKKIQEKKDDDKEKSEDKTADETEKSKAKNEEDSTVIGNLRFRVPKYNPNVAVGLSLLKEMTGQTCRACNRFFINPDEAQAHCRTNMHYNKFVDLIKEKAKAAEAKEKEKKEALKKQENKEKDEKVEEKVEKVEKGTKRTEDTSNIDDEGNWKRRKVGKADDEDEDAEADVSATNDDSVSESVVKREDEVPEEKPTVNDKYDPLEADAEESNPEDDSKASQDDSTAKDDEDKVDGDGETESLNDMDDDSASKQDPDSSPKGNRNVSRNKATRGGVAAKATRGRKKK